MTRVEEEGLLTIQDLDGVANTKSTWVDKSCCGVKVAHFPEGDLLFIGHYKWGGCRPIYNIFIFTLVTAMNFYDMFVYIPNSKIRFWLIISFAIISAFVSMSYIQVIILGPGYLPFNYSLDPSPPGSWSEWMDLIATKPEQAELARHMPHPPRSVYANSARRYVLRADHYCVWVNSWVGLRNLRPFVLMTFWAIIYCLFYIISHYWWVKEAFETFNYWIVATIVCIMPVVWSIGFAITHLINSIRNISVNVTQIERRKHRSRHIYNRGLCNNFSEVCGSKWLFLFWCLPLCVLTPESDGIYQPAL